MYALGIDRDLGGRNFRENGNFWKEIKNMGKKVTKRRSIRCFNKKKRGELDSRVGGN